MASVVGPLLVLLALIVLATGVLAARNRVPFRIAIRNVRRGRWRTVLIILGLLVGTTIISGSLVINDTIDSLDSHFVYLDYGYTDEAVYNSSGPSVGLPYVLFPVSVYTNLSAVAPRNGFIAGLTPEFVGTGSVLDRTNGIPETGINIIGVNANQSRALGSFTEDNGTSVAGPGPGAMLVDDQLATNLGAHAGDSVDLFGQGSAPLRIEGIVQDDTRGGFQGGNTAFVDLATAQTLWNASGLIDFIAVTNVGTLSGGVVHSSNVSAFLNGSLSAIGSPATGLRAYPVLQSSLQDAAISSTSTATIFLVFGLFSIIAGALLIVGIFVTLAEERKGEMGMLRAVGLRRRALVYVYYFEGAVYAAGSALVGTALGVGVGYLLLRIYIDSGVVASRVADAFTASFSVTASSLVIAYVVGFILTLAAIAGASSRVSRLNIVRAIRSVPEPPPSLRAYTYTATIGVVLVALGLLLFLPTRTGTGDLTVPLSGLGLTIVGGGLIASRFVKNRIAFSVAGLLLILWAGTQPIHQAVLGTSHSGSLFSVFVEGIEMILGAVLLFVFNSQVIAEGFGRLAGRSGRRNSVVRVGLAYPRRRPVRSAVNYTIFSMVIFTVVIVAAYSDAVTTSLENTVNAESGGYSYFGLTNAAAPGLPGEVTNNSTLAPELSNVVPLAVGGVAAFLPGATRPYFDSLFAAPTGGPPAQNFYSSNQYNFTQTLGGLSTAKEWAEVATNRSVAVVDSTYSTAGQTSIGSGHPVVALGSSVRLINPATRAEFNVTVIGYMSQLFLTGFWINPLTAVAMGYVPATGFLFRVAPGASVVTAGQDLKRAFFSEGLQLFDFSQILQSVVQQVQGQIGLLEVFVALGLAVGIAGMGIVALRAVVERRTQIGMLRATGFTRRMVLASFLVEYSYISLLGIAVGTGLAIWLFYNATLGSTLGAFDIFVVPTATILSTVLVAYGLTVVATLGPSWRAANLPPADAVRYTE